MKIRMAKSTNFLILLFLSLVTLESILSLTLQANTKGIIKATVGKNLLPDHPCYSQICTRVNKLDIINNRTSMDDVDDVDDDDVVII